MPLSWPHHFHWWGTLFIAGKGGTLCTLYTYAAGGGAVGLGERQMPSPACGALPSHSQTDVKNQKLSNNKNPRAGLMLGLRLRDRKGQRLYFELFMANTHLGPSNFLRTYHTHWSCVMHPKMWVLGRLPGNLRPGQGLEVGTSLEVTLERQL